MKTTVPMKTLTTKLAVCLFATLGLGLTGCSGEVETTDDSTRMEVEGPKVERGDEEVDLDPSTDEDVDVDTPLEGDA